MISEKLKNGLLITFSGKVIPKTAYQKKERYENQRTIDEAAKAVKILRIQGP